MNESLPENPAQEGRDGEAPVRAPAPTGGVRVIVPPLPPDIGPVAARALLDLLVAVHRARDQYADT